MQTGIKAVDSLVPIGRGQRELIIGDRQTGYAMYSQTCRNGHLLITITFVLSRCILIRYSGHLFNVVSGHHLYVIFSINPLYNGKFILKIIPKVISEDQYFSQMYQKSWGVTKYIQCVQFQFFPFLFIPPLIEWGLYCNHLVRPSVHTYVTDISASTGRSDFIFDIWLWHGDL